MKKTALIFDIDGVFCDSSIRFKRFDIAAFNRRDKEAFVKSVQEYSKDCEDDVAISQGKDLFDLLTSYYLPHDVYIITARGESGRKPTMEWLKANGFWDDRCHLIMHQENLEEFEFSTQFSHSIYKKEEAIKIMETHDVIFAVDDGEDNVNAYASLQIPTLKFIVPIGRVLV